MSLAALGAGASYEFRWRSWALLRDALVEHLGGDKRFPTFCSIGDALALGHIELSASLLAAELLAIREGLAGKTIDDLVLGPRTATVVNLGVTPKASRPMNRMEVANIRHPGTSEDLVDYFATMLDSLGRVCGHPRPDDTIEIVDG